MAHTFKFSRLAVAAALIFSISGSILADTVRLKDGSIIKGKITAFGNGKFTISVGEGARARQISYTAAEIDSIQFDSPRSTSQIVNTATRNIPVVDSDDEVIRDSEPPRVIPRVETAAKKTPVLNQPAAATPRPSASNIKPIEIGVKVLADNSTNGWTNSGFVVRKGQKIRINGSGQISIGGGKSASPSGLYDIEDTGKLLPSVPTGALIAVIGDDNNEFIYIGTSREFTASRDGALFLGVNEGNLNDNSGSFDVKIEIRPA